MNALEGRRDVQELTQRLFLLICSLGRKRVMSPKSISIVSLQDRVLFSLGSYGKVFRMRNIKTGTDRAVKQIRKGKIQEAEFANLKREFKILKKMSHPNIVQVYDLYETNEDLFIVTELLEGGELFQYIVDNHHFGEYKACKLMKTLMMAINYCHKQGVVHRDIKPENILFAKKSNDVEKIKLVDFGCSKNIEQHMNELIGTPFYLAPEVINKNYNEKCDVWSCGVILYILFTGSPPFHGKGLEDIKRSILSGKYDLSVLYRMKISHEGIQLVKSMLTFNYINRPSAETVLENPWFKKYQFPEKQNTSSAELTETFKNIRHFFKQSKLSMIIQIYLFNLYNYEDTSKLQKTFKSLDQNNDGVLTKDEIEQAIRKNRMSSQTQLLMQQIVDNMSEKSPFINYMEFIVAASSKRNILCQSRLEQAFRMIDVDRSGKLDVSELKQVVAGAQIEQLQNMIKEVDINSDGQISLAEWKKMLNNRLSVM